jgi:UDP-N-acetylglucosamine 2-epimerase (non-hydrolysing)
LHRPSNIDSEKSLSEIYDILKSVSQQIDIIYPIHPRTKRMLKIHNYMEKFQRLDNLLMVNPLGYIDFIKLVKESRFVLTDSGGIQEETTVLKVPCLTMRENSERPVTIAKGTNYLVGRNKIKIMKCISEILNGRAKAGDIPELWDGKAAVRILRVLSGEYGI